MLSEAEQIKIQARTNQIDYDRLSDLHYLGNYVRRLPTNMTRMMENAYDWEHLPHVHASSFSSIDLIESGKWGWRAKIGVPGGMEPTYQLLDLLVDIEKNYWVSTVFDGPGEGIEIHTQATTINDDEIEVDVRFYLPNSPGDDTVSAALHQYMSTQYATLYDEDIGLMQGRQSALEDRARWRGAAPETEETPVGALSDLDPDKTHVIETESGRYCLRFWRREWVAHSAVCPHLLGPLDDSELGADGRLTCPWHGYQFDVETGENLDKKCAALKPAPRIQVRKGTLFFLETGGATSVETSRTLGGNDAHDA